MLHRPLALTDEKLAAEKKVELMRSDKKSLQEDLEKQQESERILQQKYDDQQNKYKLLDAKYNELLAELDKSKKQHLDDYKELLQLKQDKKHNEAAGWKVISIFGPLTYYVIKTIYLFSDKV